MTFEVGTEEEEEEHYSEMEEEYSEEEVLKFFLVIPGARPLAYTIPHGMGGGGGALMHLCDLEARYGGVWAPNFGGAAPGFEPRTSCMRVRSRSQYAMGAVPFLIFI